MSGNQFLKSGIHLLVVGASLASASAADVFTFALVTWNQTNTPNQARLLGNGEVLGGATFSPGWPTAVTPNEVSNFPGGTGLNVNLALAALTGLGSGLRPVNLPNGTTGIATRHGIEVSWTSAYELPNLSGPDFVVFESASSSTGVEGIMARVYQGLQNSWTDWYYFPPFNYQNAAAPNCVFAYTFDLSSMGVPAGSMINKIQIANLIQSDRIAGAGTAVGNDFVGQGRVVFDQSTFVLPDAGIFAASRIFDANSLDPDPLYIAALHNIVPLIPRFRKISKHPTYVDLNIYTAPGVFTLESNDNLAVSNGWQTVLTFTNASGGTMTLSDTGQNGRPAPGNLGQRFYRIK